LWFSLQIGLIQAQLITLAETSLEGKLGVHFFSLVQRLGVHVSHGARHGKCEWTHGSRSISPLHHTTIIRVSSPSYISITFNVAFHYII